MGYYREDEIETMIAEFGEDVTVSGTTKKGIVDLTDEEMLTAEGWGHLIGKSILVTVRTGSLPALAVEGSLVRGGVTYKVVSLIQIGDGALTRVLCAMEV